MMGARMNKHSDHKYALVPRMLCYVPHSTGSSAIFKTKLGLVEALWSKQDSARPYRNDGTTLLKFVHKGFEHWRFWPKRWPFRTTARLARVFAEEIVSMGSAT